MAVEKESKAEDLLAGSETENLESDSKTSLAGEEIPHDLEVAEIDENLLEKEPPTPSEPTPEKEEAPAEAGEPELSPVDQMFKDKGLDKQFKDVDDMMNRVPEMNRYINNLGVKNKELSKLQEQAPPPTVEPEKAPSADDFYNDPVSVIQKIVDKGRHEDSQRFDEMEMNTFVNSKADYKEIEPLMEEALLDNPGMKLLGVKALEPLYQMAKAKQLSKIPAPLPAPAPNKTSAETSVGKKTAPIVKDKAYYDERSLKQLEEELGVTEQYRD